MYIVRETFTARPGQASTMARLLKQVMTESGFKTRVLTDFIGQFNTVMLETEVTDLAEFERMMAEYAVPSGRSRQDEGLYRHVPDRPAGGVSGRLRQRSARQPRLQDRAEVTLRWRGPRARPIDIGGLPGRDAVPHSQSGGTRRLRGADPLHPGLPEGTPTAGPAGRVVARSGGAPRASRRPTHARRRRAPGRGSGGAAEPGTGTGGYSVRRTTGASGTARPIRHATASARAAGARRASTGTSPDTATGGRWPASDAASQAASAAPRAPGPRACFDAAASRATDAQLRLGEHARRAWGRLAGRRHAGDRRAVLRQVEHRSGLFHAGDPREHHAPAGNHGPRVGRAQAARAVPDHGQRGVRSRRRDAVRCVLLRLQPLSALPAPRGFRRDGPRHAARGRHRRPLWRALHRADRSRRWPGNARAALDRCGPAGGVLLLSGPAHGGIPVRRRTEDVAGGDRPGARRHLAPSARVVRQLHGAGEDVGRHRRVHGDRRDLPVARRADALPGLATDASGRAHRRARAAGLRHSARGRRPLHRGLDHAHRVRAHRRRGAGDHGAAVDAPDPGRWIGGGHRARDARSGKRRRRGGVGALRSSAGPDRAHRGLRAAAASGAAVGCRVARGFHGGSRSGSPALRRPDFSASAGSPLAAANSRSGPSWPASRRAWPSQSIARARVDGRGPSRGPRSLSRGRAVTGC